MNELLNTISLILGALIIIFVSKILIPKDSYEIRLSLIIAVLLAIYFVVSFINNLNLIQFIAFLVCCFYVYRGGKELSLKTGTLVINRITKNPVGYIGAGTNWIDPLFEMASVSVDGIPNKTIDLQELPIFIPETKLMQTSTRGIQAKVKEISFMLELYGEAKRLLEIEGGAGVVRDRIIKYVDEFFLKKISHTPPEDLDQNKHRLIDELARDLKNEVNKFCQKSTNRYPYRITGDIIIGDTELEQRYYEVLARAEFAKLEEAGKNVEARMLKDRLLDLGNSLVPTGNDHEKLKAAMIALKIVPQSYEQKVFGFGPEISLVLKELAAILKNK